jgi:hypothetical protein
LLEDIPATKSESLDLISRCLTLEYGSAPALCYGIGPASESLVSRQQQLLDLIADRIVRACEQEDSCLLVGPSLGLLAARLANQGLVVTWIQVPGAPPAQSEIGPGMTVHRADFLNWDLREDFQSIVLEGTINYLDQLPILSRARQLLCVGGQLILFGEFLDNDAAIAWSGLPSLSSFRRLSERLGMRLLLEQDYSADAARSLQIFTELLQRHQTRLQQDAAMNAAAVRQFSSELEFIDTEFASGRRGFHLFELSKGAVAEGEYTDAEFSAIDSFQPQEIAVLFEESFGKQFNEALWRWKYQLGDGRCVIARQGPGGDIVSHYGGAPRKIDYFGKPAMAIQVCDVMVLPEIRRHYGKNSLFFKTAATFLEREIGNTVKHLLGFGFPNQKAMNIAIRLGLYEKTDDFVELVLPPPTAQPGRWQFTELDIEEASCWQELASLWQSMRQDFDAAIVGVRDPAYIKYRYFDHPFAADGLFRPLLARDPDTGVALALLVLKLHGEQQLLMDLVCPLATMPIALDELNCWLGQGAQRQGLKLWITRGWQQALAQGDTIVNELGIEIPCNKWNSGPAAEILAGKWWLTAGDMDFM